MSPPLIPAAADFCDCCDSEGGALTPADIFNRPGLSRLDYRVGSFATFRQAMLDAIASDPRLIGLANRDSADFAITLIELFAAVGDVLTFYNERIANELFLRTAVNRDSVARMVSMIGYRPRPGLAAKALLSFSLEAGAVTRIRRGLKVMSMPAQDERALTFETIEELVADARLNGMPVYAPPTPINPLGDGRSHAPLLARPQRLARGDGLAFFNQGRLDLKTVERLETRSDGEHLHFSAIQGPFPPGGGFAGKVLRALNLFAHDAPDSTHFFDTNPATPVTQRWKTDVPSPAIPANSAEYPLDHKLSDLKAGASLLVDLGGGNPRYQTATIAGVRDGVASYGVDRRESVTFAALRQTIYGRPKVVAVPGSGFRAFARSGTGAVLALNPINATVPFLTLTGFNATEDLDAASWGPGRLDVFARNAFGATLQNTRTGGWSGWNDLGGIATSRPTVVTDAVGSLWLFVRGLDLSLWFRRLQAGTWGPWTPLGGVLNSAPAPVSWGPGHVDVFVRGADLALWRRGWNGATWSDWEPLDGALSGDPAAVSTAPNRLDVAGLDAEGMLVHRRWNGIQWTPWQSLDGPFVETPALAASGPDQADIYARQADGTVRLLRRVGDTWMAATSLDGAAASGITAASEGGVVMLGARQGDGSLSLRLGAGAVWQEWTPVGGLGLGPIADRRSARILELDASPILFRDYDYPDTLSGGVLAARMDQAPPAIDKGRRVFLDDGRRRVIAQVTQTVVATAFADGMSHLLIGIDPPIGAPLANPVRLDGNVVDSSHGEAPNPTDEPLGNGEAAKIFQRFQLRRSPLTYLPSAKGVTSDAALEIRVNGELWSPVESLYGRKSTERVYTLRQTDDGDTIVGFGDGKTGARLPSGAMNVVARYRTGLGQAGNLKADQIAIPLERPVGLRGVTNPLAAEGGADPEPVEDARQAAPTTVRTFGRAVALDDFAWIATTSGLIARASATWVWRRLQKTIHLTVAAQGGTKLSASGLGTLFKELSQVRDPNHPLMLGNLNRVPITIQAKVMRAPEWSAEDVLAAARKAVINAFAFEVMPLATAVHESQVLALLQGATGVVAVDLDRFHLKGFETLSPTELALRSTTSASVQPHIRIYPARPTPANPAQIDRYAKAAFEDGVAPDVLPAEQAFIQDPLADLVLTVVEAL